MAPYQPWYMLEDKAKLSWSSSLLICDGWNILWLMFWGEECVPHFFTLWEGKPKEFNLFHQSCIQRLSHTFSSGGCRCNTASVFGFWWISVISTDTLPCWAQCTAPTLAPWWLPCVSDTVWCKCLMCTACGSDAAPLFVAVLFAFPGNRVSLNDTVPLSLLLTLSLVSPPSCLSSFISITGPLWLLPPGICCLSWMIPLFRALRPPSASSSCMSLFFSIFFHRALPRHAPPLVNRYGPKSHCTSAVRKNIFQSACLHAAHIAMQLEMWGALQGWNDLKSDTETWLVIFRALD